MAQLSEIASSLITILNNANELIVKSSDRQNAVNVMKAFKIYAENHNFNVPEDKINNFIAVILDARPYTLTSIIKDIAEDVVKTDLKK